MAKNEIVRLAGIPVIRTESPRGYTQIEVRDVREAVEVAEALKADGTYALFRGQRDERWHVVSTLGRLSADRRMDEVVKLARFRAWATEAAAIVPYLADDDALIAAAQHHEVAATHFIDLTTEPSIAAWFATDGGVVGDTGAIVMIDPSAVEGVFAAISESDVVLRFLRPDVANLWRLQAQSGIFLEANVDVDMIWPFDRIVFPQDGTPPDIARGRIYPEHRSHLEAMIDQYREEDLRSRGLHDLISSTNACVVDIRGPVEDGAGPGSDVLETARPDERWADMVHLAPPSMSEAELQHGGPGLEALIATRRRSLELLTVRTADVGLDACLSAAWTGMRPLSYSNARVAAGLAELVRLRRLFRSVPEAFNDARLLPQLMEDPIEVQMGIVGGGATRAWLAADDLWKAFTDRTRERLGGEKRPDGERLMELLDPFYGRTLKLFDPIALEHLFATRIIPWQVATERAIVAFWPKHIDSLGRP